LPIVRDLSPYYVALDQISLLDLGEGTFTIPANLPIACQTLYHNVGCHSILLNIPDFPDFPAVIQRSGTAPNCVGYKLLQAKSAEFGWDGTYLRITFGVSLGNSPGVLYVLEIWSAAHHSPIHDHGDSFTVIKVLHGTIGCTYFESLEEGKQPVQLGPKATLQEPAITWFGDNNYQVHQLRNTSNDVCCTIQCYQFGGTNDEHHRYFRYVDQQAEMHKFTPNSDMGFADFRRAIKKEWEALSQKA
ncbi:RmlC-like cupin domain-containing protein, partial [Mycena galopus ATCC 62051]